MLEAENTGTKLRNGFTTGSCAAAAAGAACRMLFTGKRIDRITIMTPKGIPYSPEIVDIKRSENDVICGVVKDGGDDPDVTTGLHVLARAEYIGKSSPVKGFNDGRALLKESQAEDWGRTVITGGEGVGIVTKPGLDQPVGEAAINHVPREMILEQVDLARKLCDVHEDIRITISVPGGEDTAKKTFNPRLGIVGGISILGTSGIVEPMSEQALRDTIRVELSQQKALGYPVAAVSPGNYGLDFMKRTYGYDLDRSVKCSNYIGDTIDMAAETGFSGMLLTGHLGKLIKVSGGIMNTHSKEGDCRMELLAASAIRSGADADTAREILSSVNTVEGIHILREKDFHLLQMTMEEVMNHIMFYLRKRAAGRIRMECMVYTNEDGLLAKSAGAEEMLRQLLEIRSPG